MIGNMLLRPRDQTGLLQKVQGEKVRLSQDRFPYALVKVSDHNCCS